MALPTKIHNEQLRIIINKNQPFVNHDPIFTIETPQINPESYLKSHTRTAQPLRQNPVSTVTHTHARQKPNSA